MEQARYQEIAVDIAHAVYMGEFQEGEKIHGRSTLAARFNVSPETIRRAIAILQNSGVVFVSQGIGIIVESKLQAEKFLRSFDQKGELQLFMEEIKKLMDQRREIDAQIENHLQRVMVHMERARSRFLDVEEIEVPTGSKAAGKTLKELRIREHTGVTVVAVVKKGNEEFAPAAGYIVEENDLFLVIGPQEGQQKLKDLLEKR